MTNTWKRRIPSIIAIALLSTPSALGVYEWLQPLRGMVAAAMAAAGFELAYLSLALLILTGELQRYAQRVAVGAVIVAVLLNVCVDYQTKTSGLLDTTTFLATFDVLSLVLSVVESLPAVLAFSIATLLHRLSEHEQQQTTDTTYTQLHTAYNEMHATTTTRIEQIEHKLDDIATAIATQTNDTETVNTCPYCGETLPNRQSVAAAHKHGHCRYCKASKNGHEQVELSTMEVEVVA